MTLFDYLLIAVAAIGCAGFGRLFINDDFARPLLAGILVQAFIASLMAWFAPLAIAPFFRLCIGIGWIVIFSHAYLAFARSGKTYWSFLTGIIIKVPTQNYTQAIFITIFAFIILLPYHYNNYQFFNDDVVYFGPLIEMYLADYTGRIRLPTYYPVLMTSHQLLPAASVGVLVGLLPKVTLIHAIEAKYLLVSAFMARAFYLAWRRSESSAVIFIPLLICALFLIRAEFNVLVATSSFLYMLIVVELLLLAFDSRNVAQSLLIFALAMIMARLSIFYIGAVLVGYVLLVYPKTRTSPFCIGLILLIFVNLVVLAILPKPFSGIGGFDLSFSLANPLSPKPSFEYRVFLGFDRITSHFPELTYSLAAVLISVLLGFIKYFYVTYLAIKKLNVLGLMRGDKLMRRALEILILTALAGWIIVRNSQRGGYEQIYGPISISVIAFLAVAVIASTKGAWVWRAALISVSGAALLIGVARQGPENIDNVILGYKISESTDLTKRTSYEYLQSLPRSRALQALATDDRPGIRAVRALMLGQRLQSTEVTPRQSAVDKFIDKSSEHGK